MKFNYSFLLLFTLATQPLFVYALEEKRQLPRTPIESYNDALFSGLGWGTALIITTKVWGALNKLGQKTAPIPKKNISKSEWIGALPEEIQRTVSLIKNKEQMRSFKLETPAGFLLSGPPGNGKTLLAQHMAKTLNASFIGRSAAELQSKYYGQTSEDIRSLVHSAKALMTQEKKDLCIIFLDEIDALAVKRSGITQHQMFEGGIVNQLLTLISSEENDSIIFVGATNNIHALDSALIRSGRLKTIAITNPSKENIVEIFKYYLTFHRPEQVLSEEYKEQLATWAASIEGLVSRADIKQVVINAATKTALNKEKTISLDILHTTLKEFVEN